MLILVLILLRLVVPNFALLASGFLGSVEGCAHLTFTILVLERHVLCVNKHGLKRGAGGFRHGLTLSGWVVLWVNFDKVIDIDLMGPWALVKLEETFLLVK